jgi:NADH-quinone oxidoreductase subunit J
MQIIDLVFYLFAALTLLGSLAVVGARNPVHAVLSLIFCFFNVAGLFVLLGAEYLAMTLVIVYVGAVAILFLFVVMMLNVRMEEVTRRFWRYAPLGAVVTVLLGMEILLVNRFAGPHSFMGQGFTFDPAVVGAHIPNTTRIGQVLYTDYLYVFQMAGLVLLVAMVGAISLTLRVRPGVRKQSIARQVARRRSEGVELVDVPTGSGVS